MNSFVGSGGLSGRLPEMADIAAPVPPHAQGWRAAGPDELGVAYEGAAVVREALADDRAAGLQA